MLAVMLGLTANLKFLCIEQTFFDCSMLTFEFVGEGKKGLIHKLVQYKKTNLKDIYNLALSNRLGKVSNP